MRNFFKEETPKFQHFLSVFFSGRINLKQVEKQKKKGSRGSWGHAPPEKF